MLEAIEFSALARFIALAPHVYPALSGLHVAAIGVLFGSILLADLRLVGLLDDRFEPVLPVLSRFALAGFAVAALTGMLLFVVQAAEYAGNTAFLLKLALILLAGLNAVALRRHGARALAGALSVLLWLSVIGAGRMIAFTV